MKPIEIKVAGTSSLAPEAIAEAMLDLGRWPEFKGYSIIPGIASAAFIERGSQIVGSRIQVRNLDGTSHVEEILEWAPRSRLRLRFQDFSPPLSGLATHFIEEWAFSTDGGSTRITRTMIMHPKGILGWIMLRPISRYMRKAFELQRDAAARQ